MNFTPYQKKQLETLTEFMLEYNKKVNLTRITEPAEVFEKHYMDSALIAEQFDIPKGAKLIDIGTGAGFPGVVLKIIRPDIKLTLLDSLRKRVDYLELLAGRLSITAEFVHGRAEDIAHLAKYREKFDIATARAVAKNNKLCELCIPFLKVPAQNQNGGVFLSMKGLEDDPSGNAPKLLGSDNEIVKLYSLPSNASRKLYIFTKRTQTSTKYPRKPLQIDEKPL